MKNIIYLRIAKTSGRKGFHVTASTSPIVEPFVKKDYRGTQFFPSVSFAMNVDIPDELFKQAERVIGELNVGLKEAKVTSQIVLPEGVTLKK